MKAGHPGNKLSETGAGCVCVCMWDGGELVLCKMQGGGAFTGAAVAFD